MPSNWTAFQALCRIIGGLDSTALQLAIDARLMPQVISLATASDVLPALAIRCYEQPDLASTLTDRDTLYLREALLENTQRNMRIVTQSIKLIQTLNAAGIKPLLLKGTAQLLTLNRERPGFRKQADIDLIVPPASLQAAGEALQADGYDFYRRNRPFEVHPGLAADTPAAISASAAHHHLPPLVKRDQVAFVEVHRHFLPRRFQNQNPLEPFFESASEQQINGATFLMPSTENQIIHIVLGKLLHDGYLTGRKLPLREACDYIDLVAASRGTFDSSVVMAHCKEAFCIFDQLVTELMGHQSTRPTHASSNVRRRIGLMRLRYNSATAAKLLDTYTRVRHLGYSMRYSPSKLARYLRR
ncbi:Uncharacterised protein [Halioglobus japonicus]|nr:Uncharacterised protein [Halioglobus japonicus]